MAANEKPTQALLVMAIVAVLGIAVYLSNNIIQSGSITNSKNPVNTIIQNIPTTQAPCAESQFTNDERSIFSSDLYAGKNPSLGEKCFTIQQTRLLLLQSALKHYKEGVLSGIPGEGHYPNTLQDLPSGLQKQNAACRASATHQTNGNTGLPSTSCDNISNNLVGLDTNMIDVYVGQIFPYTIKEGDYELTFTQHYFDGIDAESKSSVVDGINVATGSKYLGF